MGSPPLHQREANNNTGTCGVVGVDHEATAVLLNGLFGNGQTQARPLIFGRKVGLKNALIVLRRNARPIILNCQ